jgi:6-phosphogluconate dehydrogenase
VTVFTAPEKGIADIGVYGMGVMGANLARNFARNGYKTAVVNRSHGRTEKMITAHGSEGEFFPSETVEDFVASLSTPRVAIIMVQAGASTDEVIELLAAQMEDGDIIVDAGNSYFPDTRRREAALRERGLHFVGAGVSGGEVGALEGPSIMPGGTPESYDRLGPMFEKIAAKADEDGKACCTYVGADGAGHFIKMVHNGIEYADMQVISEAYDILSRVLGLSAPEIGEIFTRWNETELDSYLMEVSSEVLKHTDATSGKPFVDIVQDAAKQKGTGAWTVQTGAGLGVPITGIAEATFARGLSSSFPQREAGQKALQPLAQDIAVEDREQFIEDVRLSLYAAKMIAYSQGFNLINAAAEEYSWTIDLGAMASIWRAGCIIRAGFLNRITEAYDRNPELPLLLADEYFQGEVAKTIPSLRRVVSYAAAAGYPIPVYSSSLSYYDGVRAERLPANLVQAQRDFFGSHTYKRVDAEGTFHVLWSGDRSEEKWD